MRIRDVMLAVCVPVALASSTLAAQLTRESKDSALPHLRACDAGLVGGGPNCMPAWRLAFDVGFADRDRDEVRAIIDFAAFRVGVRALPMHRAAAADSAFYAEVEITRTPGGGYEVATGLVGTRVPRNRCGGARAAAVGADRPMVLGAFLASAIESLVKCAQAARGAAAPPP